jgi:hypothetical protein
MNTGYLMLDFECLQMFSVNLTFFEICYKIKALGILLQISCFKSDLITSEVPQGSVLGSII